MFFFVSFFQTHVVNFNFEDLSEQEIEWKSLGAEFFSHPHLATVSEGILHRYDFRQFFRHKIPNFLLKVYLLCYCRLIFLNLGIIIYSSPHYVTGINSCLCIMIITLQILSTLFQNACNCLLIFW